MKDFMEVLNILLKYGDVDYPFHCEHDVLYIYPSIDIEGISTGNIMRLEELGIYKNEEDDGFYSFKYGSC